ncbi:MAG: type II toxin-antitoxin system prevent-host-death family antitoxin [Gammaproteobacteria bacterium]|nr:type II toxin-antitoxin system prevent-host-death family antitoxin [Gammaproteobacteria bacterium]MCY4337592.1 type II toxin-antitoxin system prevent-host-death family antitoxin [Gammaproteobacteria bacterium]
MTDITANELKTKGVSVLESVVQEDGEAVITVRGKSKYVVLDFNAYSRLRECELEVAVQEAHKDIASGNYKTESVDEHMKRL